MKQIRTVFVTLVLILSMVMPAAAAPASVSSWATDAVGTAVSRGWITAQQGKSANAPITREEFSTMAMAFYRSFSGKSGITMANNVFHDTKSRDVLFLAENKVILPLSQNVFGSNAEITREEIAGYIVNLLRLANVRFKDSSSLSLTYVDRDQIPLDEYAAVAILSDAGVLTGYNGYFYPFNSVTVEQAASMLLKAEEAFRLMPVTVSGKNVFIGMTKEEAAKLLGKAQKTYTGELGTERHVYNKDPKNLLVLGYKNNLVAEIFSNAQTLSFYGMTRETKRDTVNFVSYTAGQTGGQIKSYQQKVRVFFDEAGDNTLQAVHLISWDLKFNKSFVAKTSAPVLLDVVNGHRLQKGLSAMKWSDKAAYSAFRHALESSYQKNPGYINRLRETPFQRMTNYGISYAIAAEVMAPVEESLFAAFYAAAANSGAKSSFMDTEMTHIGFSAYGKDKGLIMVSDMYLPE